jgi:hypothetical protein
MQIKPNRPTQIVTLVFALTLVATYVVYSQRQRAKTITPASLAAATNGFNGGSVGGTSTNHIDSPRALLVAPGSKSMAPLLDVRPAKASHSAPDSPPVSRPAMVAPGPKSAPIFDLREQPQIQKQKPTAIKRDTPRTMKVTAKSPLTNSLTR